MGSCLGLCFFLKLDFYFLQVKEAILDPSTYIGSFKYSFISNESRYSLINFIELPVKQVIFLKIFVILPFFAQHCFLPSPLNLICSSFFDLKVKYCEIALTFFLLI